jgi:hypothetical protein
MNISNDFLDNFKDNELLEMKRTEIDPVLKTVKKFFITNKIVLYGGTAMNLYLPDDKQFYNKLDIPDYDGYSSDAKPLSLKLIDILKKKNYNFLFVKRAIHDGTFKVSWEFKDVADITQINKTEYDMILSTSTIKNNLYLCNINLLKSNAYVELCLPKSAMFRWSKVFSRLKLLEESNPLKTNTKLKSILKNDSLPESLDTLLFNLKRYIKSNKYPITGMNAVAYYLGNNEPVKNQDYFLIEILSDNINETINNVKRLLKSFKDIEYSISQITSTQLVPNNINITVYVDKKEYKLISIYDATRSCYAVESKKNGDIIVSIFFLLHVYYYKLFMSKSRKDDNLHKCLIINLIKNVRNERITDVCYGYNKSISAIMKSRSKKNIPVVLAKYVPSEK